MQATPPQSRLGQLLLNSRSITQRQLREALSYQKENACRLGEALIAMGAIDESLLRKVLRRQRWLRPCAACFALMSPFSVTYAYDPDQDLLADEAYEYTAQWQMMNPSTNNSDDSQVTRLLGTAMDVYMGAPERGEWRYNISRTRTNDSDGYQVEVRLFF